MKKDIDLTTISGRLRYARVNAGLSQKKLGDIVGCKQQSIWGLENTPTYKLYNINKYCDALNVTKEWLQFGDSIKESKEAIYDGSDFLLSKNMVPFFISWKNALHWCNNLGLYDMKQVSNFLSFNEACSKKSFALKIKDDSMAAPAGIFPTFPKGITIIADPNKNWVNGSFVLAQTDSDESFTFKQYVEDGSKRYLKPINPQYPIHIMSNKDKIKAVVIAFQGLLV